MRNVLSPRAELDVLDWAAVEGELEVVDGAHDGGVEAVGIGLRPLPIMLILQELQ